MSRFLALIPARGGSKGIPKKNIKMMNGKPLIAWTIEEAQKSKYLDRVILSSENEEIIDVARKWCCEVPFTRPMNLAEDHTPGIAPVLHALEQVPGYEFVVLLQPTSPLRTVEDIDKCIELFLDTDSPSCVSVTVADKNPHWMYYVSSDHRLSPVLPEAAQYTRRQDMPNAYALNGAIYIARVDWLKKSRSFLSPETSAYLMPKERSFDIDTELDFLICEHLLKNRD